MASEAFYFKKFSVFQHGVAHSMGTDSVLLGAWANVAGCKKILDIGTGTGVVALMLAQRLSAGQITGIDIHTPSVQCARTNAEASPWKDRLTIREISLQALAEEGLTKFDLIVSNPPFFSEATRSPDPDRSIGRHTATLTPADLSGSVARLLEPQGKFCLILPVKEGILFREMAVLNRLYCNLEVVVRSFAQKPAERLLMQFSSDPGFYRKEELILFESGRSKTPSYSRLTDDFYQGSQDAW